jgi:acyl dehydratase
MSATDLRHEHPANRSIPGFASTSLATRFVRPPAAGATGFTWVEHRLTATLQLRLSTPIVSRRNIQVALDMARTRYRSVLAGAAIDGPSGDIPRTRCFQPRAELAT